MFYIQIFDIKLPHTNQNSNNGISNPFYKHNILDRNGTILVTNLPIYTLFFNPAETVYIDSILKKLKIIFPDIDNLDEIKTKLSTHKKGWVSVKNNITEEQKQAILSSGIEGAFFEKTYKRFYPHGNLFSHILGYSNSNMQGMYGVERYFDKELKSSPLTLSIDSRVQAVLYNYMEDKFIEHNSVAAFGMIADVKTGELLGLVSLPSFNPNASLWVQLMW